VEYSQITEQIIGAAYEVYNEMGFGFLESVYEKCMVIALADRGIDVRAQQPIVVYFRGHVVGEFDADLLVDATVIVELKSSSKLVEKNEVQLVNYLVATQKPVGLLVNFGPNGIEVKRKLPRLPNQSAS
jgi:GxxExxY protein